MEIAPLLPHNTEIGAAQTFEQRETDKDTESYIILKILLTYCKKKLFQ